MCIFIKICIIYLKLVIFFWLTSYGFVGIIILRKEVTRYDPNARHSLKAILT